MSVKVAALILITGKGGVKFKARITLLDHPPATTVAMITIATPSLPSSQWLLPYA